MMCTGGVCARGCGGVSAARSVTFSEPAHQVLADHRAGECHGVGAHLARRDIRGVSVCLKYWDNLCVCSLKDSLGTTEVMVRTILDIAGETFDEKTDGRIGKFILQG